jgi:mono/diheme cytochrome c family protein
MRVLTRLVVALLAAVGLVSLAVGAWLFASGISTQPDPSSLESTVARRLRSWMIPADAHRRPNPVTMTREALDAGMEHFADHCAVCHANDGSGSVEMGENLYPRSPDLRAPATQSLSDGALFYIIEQGVRLTGMPGWTTGTQDGELESWRLVHFIRHLPELTDEERRRMEKLNPRSAEEWREEQEVERFLAGEDASPPNAVHDEHGGHE